jgi:hypothetical protein
VSTETRLPGVSDGSIAAKVSAPVRRHTSEPHHPDEHDRLLSSIDRKILALAAMASQADDPTVAGSSAEPLLIHARLPRPEGQVRRFGQVAQHELGIEPCGIHLGRRLLTGEFATTSSSTSCSRRLNV